MKKQKNTKVKKLHEALRELRADYDSLQTRHNKTTEEFEKLQKNAYNFGYSQTEHITALLEKLSRMFCMALEELRRFDLACNNEEQQDLEKNSSSNPYLQKHPHYAFAQNEGIRRALLLNARHLGEMLFYALAKGGEGNARLNIF